MYLLQLHIKGVVAHSPVSFARTYTLDLKAVGSVLGIKSSSALPFCSVDVVSFYLAIGQSILPGSGTVLQRWRCLHFLR